MTGRTSAARTSLRLLTLVWLFCATSYNIHALPQPEPLPPGFVYGDNLAEDAESRLLLNRLRQLKEQEHRVVEHEHEITDEQIEIEAVLQAKAMEQQRAFHSRPDYSAEGPEPEPEALPIPAAMVHGGQMQSGKRTKSGNGVSYMSLCHFKICNMGRKRQSA